MRQNNMYRLIAAFLLGLVVGAGALYYFGASSFEEMNWPGPAENTRESIEDTQEPLENTRKPKPIEDGCPDGMRRHFNEMTGGQDCVPDDYIGI